MLNGICIFAYSFELQVYDVDKLNKNRWEK